MIQSVREGSTGILYFNGGGAEGQSSAPSSVAVHESSPVGNDSEIMFVPNYDMDAAIDLLREFQKLEQIDGRPLTASYKARGFNWYPAMVSYLFWHVFFPYIKYQPLVSEYLKGNKQFLWKTNGTFRALITVFDGGNKSTLKTRLHYWLIRVNNRLVVRRNRVALLYFSFGRSDFRAKEVRETLSRLGSRFIEVVPPTTFRAMIQNILGGGKEYYYGREPNGKGFNHRYDVTGLAPDKQKLFAVAIQVVERTITSFLTEYEDHLQALEKCDATTFYGLDDINGYIFPLLYACRTRGMRTIGHQHGAYVKRHAGYTMPGIAREDFTWFDQVIVWGEYWKEKLLQVSSLYTPEFFIIGANKFTKTYALSPSQSESPKNVLIPYEFLTNTFKVGRYIQKLIDLGYNIFFKPRPDEKLSDQLDAYCLPAAYRDRLTVVTNLDQATLGKIDVVAGTMTTLIYELLPYNKIVWIFETEYRHLEDLVEEGLAHKVRYEDLETLGQYVFSPTLFPADKLFGRDSLSDTLRNHVVSAVNPRL